MNVASIRKDFVAKLDSLTDAQPPQITQSKKKELLAKFESIVKAGGTPGLEDDAQAMFAMGRSVLQPN
jgi:hypothetical protein